MSMRLALGLVLLASAPLQAQSPAPELNRTVQLESRVLGERRTIDVALPRNYRSDGTQRYPLIIVLDGESEHEIAAAITRFYAASSQLPHAIVVGVRNTHRSRDLTPTERPGFTPPQEAGATGGATQFLAFLERELLPHLDSTYRTVPLRVLVGHSLGGLFALHSLAARPALFTGYVVMEPSVWWNDQHELREAERVLATPPARRARLMLVNTPAIKADTTRWGGDKPMVRRIDVANETHQSMAAAGMMSALRTLFADFRPAQWVPGTSPIRMIEHYDSLSARLGYTVTPPPNALESVARMAIHGRYFDDAARIVERMRKAGDPNEPSVRAMLAEERAAPLDPKLIPLVIPAKRPSPADARAFIGRWTAVDGGDELEVRASGDTILVHQRIRMGDGSWDEHYRDVIQVTPTGTLEWGLRWFINLPALVVLKGSIQPDGTLRVSREPRGWVPRGPGGEMTRVTVFRRAP